ncbi:hypothetical protein KQX54_003064 [Cotesia glomerata]|uniref:Uncharacterized protein n=1 Tax=Cotesia glomerata TaxID=32391 RepID=A0AAV7HGJ0_COTGL|nr:hypothetical protein KQX54_003064 [Cotesia glomerata]
MNSLVLSHGLLNSTFHTRIQCNLTQRWCTLRQTVGSDAKRAIAKLKTEDAVPEFKYLAGFSKIRKPWMKLVVWIVAVLVSTIVSLTVLVPIALNFGCSVSSLPIVQPLDFS